ncbi:MAG: sulfite exporter TauE/SafE family protein [Hyphomicrobiales bacterium]
MTPLEFWAFLAAASVGAGFIGSMLGLGGGLLLVPILTLGFGLDIRYAIGASIVSVIATSSGAAIALVRERLANLRVAMFLESGTTAGALTGAFLAGVVNSRWLFLVFGLAMAYAGVTMFHRLTSHTDAPAPDDALADRLGLHAEYHEPGEDARRIVPYRVAHTLPGLGLMVLAGAASGLLGIGSGALKVPAMDIAMRLPIKVSSATSNFMIGVTAAASAGVYFARGDINPFVAGPVCVGVLTGSFLGSRLLVHAPGRAIRTAFVIVLVWIAYQMFRKGLAG